MVHWTEHAKLNSTWQRIVWKLLINHTEFDYAEFNYAEFLTLLNTWITFCSKHQTK